MSNVEVESNNSVASANSLTSGVRMTGQASSSSDVDYYKLYMSSAGTAQFSLSLPSSNYDSYTVDLYDTSGVLQRSYTTSSGGNYSIASQQSGNVYVKISSYWGRADYQLSALSAATSGSVEVESNNSVASANSLTSGVRMTGQASSSSDVDYYKLYMSSAGTAQFSLSLPSSNYDSYTVDLYDTSGVLQRSYTTSSGGNYSIASQQSGNVYVKISSYWGRADYQLSALSTFTSNVAYSLTSQNPSINEGSTASFTLNTTNVATGTSVPYTLTGISAADVSGGALSGNAVVNSSGVATISITLLNDNLTEGAETLTVTAGGASASTVVNDTSKAVDDYSANSTTSGRLTLGSSVTGNIETSGDRDWFAVSLTSGSAYQFRLNANTLNDPYLRLYNSSGTLLTENDDSGGGNNSLISYTATTTGTYYLGTADYSRGTGGYTLSSATISVDDYSANSTTSGRLTLGSSVTGNIETSGDRDWFAVSLTSGSAYQFRLNANTLNDPYLRLYNSSGTLLTENDDSGGGNNSLISYTATTTGTYYLGTADYSRGTGGYTLSSAVINTPNPTTSTSSSFQITVNYSGDSAYASYFTEAAARWSQIIIGDLPNVGTIDDLLISASVITIDGAGGILGQASPTALRGNGGLPYRGFMNFDSADLRGMLDRGTLSSVILHEMGHVLGLGSLWRSGNFVSNSDPYQYIGPYGLEAYKSVSGNSSASYVPLETTGGRGTAGGHWSESLFNSELMTGYAENYPPMPISIVTVGALQDLGYTVNYAAADIFRI